LVTWTKHGVSTKNNKVGRKPWETLAKPWLYPCPRY
jgi:hypothetical protein